MEEIYIPIVNYEGLYEVSNYGNIKSTSKTVFIGNKKNGDPKFKITNDRILKIFKSCNSYINIHLYKDGNKKTFLVHRLMAISFIPNPKNKEFVNHIDGNKLNNNLLNLEWCTRKENNDHGYSMGLMHKSHGVNHTSAKLNDKSVKEIRQRVVSETQTSLAKEFGVTQQVIYNCIIRKIWKHVL